LSLTFTRFFYLAQVKRFSGSKVPPVLEQETDVLLIGGGIMSATLGTWLQELEPDWSITMVCELGTAIFFFIGFEPYFYSLFLFSAGETILGIKGRRYHERHVGNLAAGTGAGLVYYHGRADDQRCRGELERLEQCLLIKDFGLVRMPRVTWWAQN
jgi:hypothetical protein